MKKFITILMSCSLTLAASVMAQQEEAAGTPQTPQKEQVEKSHPARVPKPAVKPESVRESQTKLAGQENGALKTEATPKTHAPMKAKGKGAVNAETNANATASPSANAEGNKETRQGKKQRNAPNAKEATTVNKAATASPTPATVDKATASPSPVTANAPSATPATAASPSATAAQANATSNLPTNKVNAQAKKPDPQAIQKIKTEHASFRAQPRPDKVPTVTFNQSYRISGSEQWQGEKYAAFRSYHPERHERGWYHSHYNRVELIGGGYYYWNQGYWYPAWGYDNSAQYYAYDGPIYVGHNAEPPDKVIAEVQAILQQEGYYTGEVDGLLGPLTRQALTAYQADNGLAATAAIDEPTLASLDLA